MLIERLIIVSLLWVEGFQTGLIRTQRVIFEVVYIKRNLSDFRL